MRSKTKKPSDIKAAIETRDESRKRLAKALDALIEEARALNVPLEPSREGRPTKYEPAFCGMLLEHMAKGLSFECFGAVVHVTAKTLYNWKDDNPEFLQAHKLGENYCRMFWEQLGAAGASGHLPGFNASAFIFNMKNRFDWTDKRDVTSGGKPLPNGPRVVIRLPKNGSESGGQSIDITPTAKAIKGKS